jgi:hypothetical protein
MIGSAASASAIARPIPRLAPVTRTVQPVRSMLVLRGGEAAGPAVTLHGVWARVGIVLACAAIVAGLAVRLRDHDACQDARSDVFALVAGRGSHDDLGGDLRTIEDRCSGTEALVATAGALRTIGEPRAALKLARDATEREPASFSAWRARAALARGTEAREATARAQRLNPRWRPRARAAPPLAAAGP